MQTTFQRTQSIASSSIRAATRGRTRPFVLLALAASLGGCIGTKVFVPDTRLASLTANMLGVNAEDVAISNRRGGGLNTYYTARVGGRSYACMVNGGNAMTFGMVNPPLCNLAPGSASPGP